ncbi:MAG TPA: hypothetical protein VIY28_20165 [Pseudonocardiaceae bacterium]
MTWPDGIHQLDEDLAAGLLSPEEHARRCDELMQGPAQPANPFPPPFSWDGTPPEASTQVMSAVPRNTNDPADTTQVVRTGDVQDSDRTQVVPGQQGGRPAPSYQQGQVKDLFQPLDNSAPPWASSDLPPIADQQSAWMRQGPEVFATPAMQSRSKQIVGIAVVAVLVLGLAVAGVAYSLSKGSPNQASTVPLAHQPNQPNQPNEPERVLPAPPPPRAAPVDTTQALIDPPGQTRGGGGLLDLPLVESGKLVPRPILSALRAGGMTDGVLKTTTEGANTIGMFAFTLRNEQAATGVANTIVSVQRDGGLKDDGNRAQQGVTVLGTDPSSPSTVYRAVYVLYNRVIFFETMGPDREAVQATFDSLIRQQVTYAPPTVRALR